jgi:hypothetical protein
MLYFQLFLNPQWLACHKGDHRSQADLSSIDGWGGQLDVLTHYRRIHLCQEDLGTLNDCWAAAKRLTGNESNYDEIDAVMRHIIQIHKRPAGTRDPNDGPELEGKLKRYEETEVNRPPERHVGEFGSNPLNQDSSNASSIGSSTNQKGDGRLLFKRALQQTNVEYDWLDEEDVATLVSCRDMTMSVKGDPDLSSIAADVISYAATAHDREDEGDHNYFVNEIARYRNALKRHQARSVTIGSGTSYSRGQRSSHSGVGSAS